MKITIKNLQKKVPVSPKEVQKTILKALSCERIKKTGEITVCFVGDKKIRELNKKFLHKDMPTDVLAFEIASPRKCGARNDTLRPSLRGAQRRSNLKVARNYTTTEAGMLADIVISADTAIQNSTIFKTSPSYEMNLYLVHGLLHILGYDDRSSKQRRLMRKKEREYAD